MTEYKDKKEGQKEGKTKEDKKRDNRRKTFSIKNLCQNLSVQHITLHALMYIGLITYRIIIITRKLESYLHALLQIKLVRRREQKTSPALLPSASMNYDLSINT